MTQPAPVRWLMEGAIPLGAVFTITDHDDPEPADLFQRGYDVVLRLDCSGTVPGPVRLSFHWRDGLAGIGAASADLGEGHAARLRAGGAGSVTAKTPRAPCECGATAIASAYGRPMCMSCYREAGFDDPKLLGGRRSSDARPPDDDGGPGR